MVWMSNLLGRAVIVMLLELNGMGFGLPVDLSVVVMMVIAWYRSRLPRLLRWRYH